MKWDGMERSEEDGDDDVTVSPYVRMTCSLNEKVT